MARTIALYDMPKALAHSTSTTETTHVSIAQPMPGLRSIELSKGPVVTTAADSTYHHIGTLRFDSMNDLDKPVYVLTSHDTFPAVASFSNRAETTPIGGERLG